MKKMYLCVIILVIALLAGCGGETEVSEAPSVAAETTTASETTTEAETTTIEETTTEAAPAVSTLSINETGSITNWSVTVTNSQILDEISENQYSSFRPDDGNKYLFVTVSVTNDGKSAATFLPTFGMNDAISAKVIYGDGYEFSLTNLLGYSKNLTDMHLNPLSTKEGDAAFEIPDAVASSEEPLILEFSAGKENLSFKLR